MENSTKIIIQARTGSTRLPQKMIIPFFRKKGLFEIILTNLLEEFEPQQIILATTQNPKDDILSEIAGNYHVNVYRGSENDVLSRFTDAAQKYNAEHIIRVCADNPFLQNQYIKTIIQQAGNAKCDYLSYAFPDGTPTIKSHIGLFAEYVSLDALKKVETFTQESLYREHVTNFIYAHPSQFDIKFLDLPKFLQNKKHIRLTIDTQNDFELMQNLYAWYKSNPHIDVKSLILKIEQSDELKTKMLKEIQRNEK